MHWVKSNIYCYNIRHMMVMIIDLHFITKRVGLQNRVRGESVLLLVSQTLSSTTSLTDTQFRQTFLSLKWSQNVWFCMSVAARIFHRPFSLIICHRGCTFYYGYWYKPIPGLVENNFYPNFNFHVHTPPSYDSWTTSYTYFVVLCVWIL